MLQLLPEFRKNLRQPKQQLFDDTSASNVTQIETGLDQANLKTGTILSMRPYTQEMKMWTLTELAIGLIPAGRDPVGLIGILFFYEIETAGS